MKNIILGKLKEFAYFIWLILLMLIAVFVTYFYEANKKNQTYYLQKSFQNVYLNKSFKSLISNLKPRYILINYKVKKGDTYENIIENINVPITEKRKFLESVEKQKEIKYLKLNQEIFLKLIEKIILKLLSFK